jgi:flagellar biosynthesis protein FliR
LDQQQLLGVALVFCRVGTATMLLPGFAIARVPMLFRVLLAFSVSATAYPFLHVNTIEPSQQTRFIAVALNELLVGVFFGFMCALFAHAVRFSAGFTMALIGLAGIPGQPIEDLEANSPFVMLLSIVFTALVFATDIYLVSLRALLETYAIYPLGSGPAPAVIIENLAIVMRDTSFMALQASSPFLIHGLGINFALGLVGKLTPQLQAYFSLMGLATLVSFLVLFMIGSPMLSFLISSYADWLENGL